MRVIIDDDMCVGCGLCFNICPEVFEMNAENVAKIKEGSLIADVKEECIVASDACPVDAIRVID